MIGLAPGTRVFLLPADRSARRVQRPGAKVQQIVGAEP